MKNTAERLEQALRCWEDRSFLLGVHHQLGNLGVVDEKIPRLGPLFHWHEFRDYLLSNHSNTFDAAKFFTAGDEEGGMSLIKYFAAQAFLPMGLFCWTVQSRRVFHVTNELQTLLSLTSLDGMHWNDITWPFNSFAVTLDAPIVVSSELSGQKREIRYDTILVFRFRIPSPEYVGGAGHAKEHIRFMLIDQELEKRVPLSAFDRDELSQLLAKGARGSSSSRRKFFERMNEELDNTNNFYGSTFFLDGDKAGNLKIRDTTAHVIENSTSLDGDDRKDASHFEIAARIVAGLCLYLTTLPTRTSHRSEWRPADSLAKRPDPRAITTGAEVCLVSSVYELTAQEREVIERVGPRGYYELCCHFRRGTWRRKPGFGQDPTAPKVVHVRPTIVRKDRLPEGAVPGGSANILAT